MGCGAKIRLFLAARLVRKPYYKLALSYVWTLHHSRILSLSLSLSLALPHFTNLVNVRTHSTRLNERLGWLFQADASSEKLLLDDMKKAQVNVMDVVVLLFLELRS